MTTRFRRFVAASIVALATASAVLVAQTFNLQDTIPFDSAVRTARLPNGLTYFIRQKPKCGFPIASTSPVQYSAYAQVGEATTTDGTIFLCPQGSIPLPSLCPFLSKHSDVVPDAVPDGNINSFHGSLAWTFNDSTTTTVHASLTKGTDIVDNWDIDLFAPCFKGQCAQDNLVPPAYQLDPVFEHQQLGCDLWVEVDGIPQVPQGQ